MSLLGAITVLGLAAGYITKVMLLESKVSHEGPLKFKNVYLDFEGAWQKFCLFDVIRYLAGAYYWRPEKIKNSDGWVFRVRYQSGALERWTCPKCLSFWVSLPLSIIYGHTIGFSPVEIFITLFAVAQISEYLNRE